MTLFSVATSLLAACTGLSKRAGAEHLWRGCAVDKPHAESCSSQAYFWPGYVPGTAPKSGLGVIAAGFAPSSASAASHSAPRGPEHPCGSGCCNSPYGIWGALNRKAHPKDTM